MAKYNATTSKYTSYFLSDSVFTPKKGFDHLIDAEGCEHKEEHATLFAKKFFENFFTEQSTSPPANDSTIPEFLKNIPIDKIKKIPQNMLDQYTNDITAEELDIVIRKNHKGSAPGLSGISYELVKNLYTPLRPLLLKFANQSIKQDTLSPFLRNRKVIFIPKPNKPETDIGSYRPICLLEIPYKLISSIIAERLKNFSNHMITFHQNAYTNNSNIANCSRTILDMRTLATTLKIPLAIIGLDFSSAFDRISHSYCFEAMRYFGFPEDLIIKVKTLLNKPILNLLINDDICDPFQQADVGSGQGDPISAFLFCISIQPLLLRLAYDPEIRKFQHVYNDVEGNEAKVIGEPTGFADDIHLFHDPTNPESLLYLLDTLKEFSSISNLKLNHKKTEFMNVNVEPPTMKIAKDKGLAIVDNIKFVGSHTIRNDDSNK